MSDGEQIELGPAAVMVAAVAAAMANITGLATQLGASSFACDVVGALTFMFATIYWAKRAWESTAPITAAGFVTNGVSRRRRWAGGALAQGAAALVFLGLAIWFAIPAVQKATHPVWQVCGTVTVRCGSTFCAVGVDDRHRPISSICVPPRDASGYMILESHDWITYRPAQLRFQCDGKEFATAEVPAAFKDGRCDSLLEVR